MGKITVTLPTLTQTSSAVDTSTGGNGGEWDIKDGAEAIAFTINGVTTAPGIIFQGSHTSSDGSTFGRILQTPVSLSSLALTMYVSSSGIFTYWPLPYKKVRFATSNVISTSYTVTGSILYDI